MSAICHLSPVTCHLPPITSEMPYSGRHGGAGLPRSSRLGRARTPCRAALRPPRRLGVLASCASGLHPVVSAYAPHFGEEPCLSGTRGAGNVFFGNCNLRCVYCQNWQISQDFAGQRANEVPVERLAEMLLELQKRGCHNIGFVPPTHYAPQMAKAILLAARQ